MDLTLVYRLRSHAALVLSVLLCAGCATSTAPVATSATTAAPPRSFFAGPIPLLDAENTGRESRACTQDADCVLTCDIDGRCCPQLCACTNALSRTFADKLRAHISALCKAAPCPIARCMMPKATPIAVCQNNTCAVRWSDEAAPQK